MRMLLSILLHALFLSAVCGQAPAPASPATSPSKVSTKKLEAFLLLPEPRSMRSKHALSLGSAQQTVFSPVKQVAGLTGLQTYSETEFAKLGISTGTFEKKAREAADRLLATLQPEFIKDDAGRVRYAVYRGEEPIFACLLVAPSLAKVFEKVFGKEVWVAAPDRNSLFIFPPNPTIVDDFAADLQDRFESNAYSASEEVFVLRSDTGEMRAVGNFTDR